MLSILLPLLLLQPVTISDGFSSHGQVHLVRIEGGQRFIDPEDVTHQQKQHFAVPKAATFVVPCPEKSTFFFVGHDGVFRANGTLLTPRENLFSATDPAHLYVAPLCAPDGKTLRLPSPKGIEIISTNDGKLLQVLPFISRAKSYSGHVHQGRSRERAYAVALSVYVPRMFDFDVNQDGLQDLVVLADAVLSIYLKETTQKYAQNRIRHDLKKRLQIPAARPLHVVFGDLDNTGKASLVLTHSQGILPSETEIAIYDVNGRHLQKRFSTEKDGWWFPMGAQNGAWFRQIDTSILSLGQALMTQEADMTLWRFTNDELQEHTTLRAHFDLRSRKQNSQLPLLADLNGDGWPELTTLSKSHLLEMRQGSSAGFSKPKITKNMPAAAVWVPTPHALLVIEIQSGKVHRLQLPAPRARRY